MLRVAREVDGGGEGSSPRHDTTSGGAKTKSTLERLTWSPRPALRGAEINMIGGEKSGPTSDVNRVANCDRSYRKGHESPCGRAGAPRRMSVRAEAEQP